MQKTFFFFTAFCAAVSCGKISPEGNEIKVRDLKTEAFNKVDLKGNFHAFFIKSDSANLVSAESYPNIIDNLSISVKDSTLTISEKRQTEKVDFCNITLYGTADLRSVTISDSADLQLSTQTMTDNFLLNLSGNSKFIGSALSNTATVNMKDKAKANLLGKTLSAQISIKDSAQLVAPFWYLNHLKINAKNATYSEINVSESLNGNIANTSKLIYYGDPVKKLEQKDKATVMQNMQKK